MTKEKQKKPSRLARLQSGECQRELDLDNFLFVDFALDHIESLFGASDTNVPKIFLFSAIESKGGFQHKDGIVFQSLCFVDS
jgi:hypothetical protein